MPQVVFENVKLAFTQNMETESPFGGYNFSFIINKETFCDTVRKVLAIQKVKCWDDSKNTDSLIIKKCNAKSKDDITFDPVKEMMTDDDLLIQVKSKNAPIENTKSVRLGRGTTADILIDIFEYSYGKRDFICIRSHADRYCTVKVLNLVQYMADIKGFEKENTAAEGFNKNALDSYISSDVETDLALY